MLRSGAARPRAHPYTIKHKSAERYYTNLKMFGNLEIEIPTLVQGIWRVLIIPSDSFRLAPGCSSCFL